MVAPGAEIAERERQQIEANKQIAELAPLRSEFVRIRYAKALDIVGLFEAGSEDGGSSDISPRLCGRRRTHQLHYHYRHRGKAG